MGSGQRASAIHPPALLMDLYRAAVAAAAPGPAVAAALDRDCTPPPDRPLWILSIGKAAPAMAKAAVAHLARYRREPAGGIVIAPAPTDPPHRTLTMFVGDHPLPGPKSLAAAQGLEDTVSQVEPGAEAWVLLSGGATSLAAAPAGAFTQYELMTLHTVLLNSGLDIRDMNVVRRRFSRWGAGRLAVALNRARVRNYIVSDVVGDDLSTIGSGPCVPDEATAGAVRRLLAHAGLWERTPSSLRDHLAAVDRDASLETPKPGHAAFRDIEVRIVASNRLALEGAAARAEANGVSARVMDLALGGEAALAGQSVARMLLGPGVESSLARGVPVAPVALLWGGETVVRLDYCAAGAKGGRCQELALAAAQELAAAGTTPPLHFLLAAGTDGRDGSTDAAGAIVHRGTWDAIRQAGRDPQRDLAYHNAYHALDAARALLRTGLTGTNVMDIVIGLRVPDAVDAATQSALMTVVTAMGELHVMTCSCARSVPQRCRIARRVG